MKPPSAAPAPKPFVEDVEVAVGNLLPAWVQVVCVDINPSAVIKLSDRGSFQTVPVVTDIEPFLRALLEEVSRLEAEIS